MAAAAPRPASRLTRDPALLAAFRAQAGRVIASGDPLAFLGLWSMWRDQQGVSRQDLVDVLSDLAKGNRELSDVILDLT